MKNTETENGKWPNKNKPLFPKAKADLNSPTWCALNWISDFASDDSYYASAFKKAGDKIISDLARGSDPELPDQMFIPTAFLYRHALELKLKSVVKKGATLKATQLTEVEINKSLGRHRLDTLWKHFRLIATTHWPDGATEDLDAAEQIVLEFHALDISGQHLRYSHDKEGNKTAQTFPDSVELSSFQDTFEGLFHFLDCCEMDFDHCIEIQAEIDSTYEQEDFS